MKLVDDSFIKEVLLAKRAYLCEKVGINRL